NSTANLRNSIVFSAGCHSGYNLLDVDQLNPVSQPLDWAQAFSRKGATFSGGPGFQYGDDELVEYGERIYAEFAHQLRVGSGPVSVGNALTKSKQIYPASTPDIRVLHAKSILESTLFGLPMLSVTMPAGRDTSGTPASSPLLPDTVSPGGASLGLQAFKYNPLITPTTAHTLAHGTYLSGADGIATNIGAPVLTLHSEDLKTDTPRLSAH